MAYHVNPSAFADFLREEYESRGYIGITMMADATWGVSRTRFREMLDPDTFVGSTLTIEEVMNIADALSVPPMYVIDAIFTQMTDEEWRYV